MELDPRNPGAAGGDRERHTLEEREVHVDVERFGFKARQAIGGNGERVTQRLQIGQPL